MIERLFLPDRLMGMKLPIDRVRGRSLDCLRDLRAFFARFAGRVFEPETTTHG